MVIGFDAKRAFCNNTGLGNYSRMICGGMAKELETGHCVLYSPKLKGRHEHYFDGLERVELRKADGLWSLAPWFWRSMLGFMIEKDGVEIFHGLSHELPYGIAKGVKKVVTMHDLIVRRYPDYFKPADRIIHRLKQGYACRTADLVVAISEQTKRDLMDMMGVAEEKIRVVYQSCDPIFWNAMGRSDVIEKYNLPKRYILCVGTLEERKNQQNVIRAMQHLPEEMGLVIVGRPRGDYGRQVLAMADDKIRIVTGADFSDFPALYAGAVASVYMSHFEGFGIPVLESLCCDTPVVTSNISSMPEAGGDAALYADPDDVEGIAYQLRRLIEDEPLRKQCIEKGRIHRLKFAPEKVTQDLLAVYKELLHH